MTTRMSVTSVVTPDGGNFRAMVVEFVGDRVIQPENYTQKRRERIEHAFVDFARESRALVMLMRMHGPRGSWSVDAGDDADALYTVCKGLARDHLPTYIALLDAGVDAIIHTDVPPAFAESMRRASREVAREIAHEVLGQEPDVAPERYLLENMSFYLSQDFDFLMTRVLPRMMPRLHRRAPHVRTQLAAP